MQALIFDFRAAFFHSTGICAARIGAYRLCDHRRTGLLLASVGIYGMVSFAVSQTHTRGQASAWRWAREGDVLGLRAA